MAAANFKVDLQFTLGHGKPPLVWHFQGDGVVHLHGDHIVVRTELAQQFQGLFGNPGKVTDDANQRIMPGDADGVAQHVIELHLLFTVRACCA
ncbi:hypothetical protein D3C76_1595090 [compost metagenome]